MTPLLNIPKDQVPEFHATTSFPKKSNLFISSVFLSLPLLIAVILLGEILQNFFQEKPLISLGDLTSFLIVLLPLLVLTLPYFIQEKRRHTALKNGTPILGVFFSEDTLLWCIKEDVYHRIPKSHLKKFELRGKISGGSPLTGWLAEWIELSGDGFCVRIENASDYELAHLISFLHTWKPDIEFVIDTRLDHYDVYTSFPKKPADWIKI